ncbi:beta-ketoacyl-[acyl-carrier-protein] synthase family protein [Microbacterium hydrocarbonoxydans]|uniref:beta-ketoacyl-[acyl-carrier-protein] synthase family protein n=1 Tax=Microbacterium hydrocarbonoxydans TaxID=273678 RepID=UPI0013DAC0F9|nr:beta-ketoacyl-[acyl-carrier-protein] synthase family protein [Microbacterium hydrocarbonoxydans]
MTAEVVITGVGAVTPSGLTAAALWEAVRDGRSGITRLSEAASPGSRVQVGGVIRGFAPDGGPAERRLNPVQRWAMTAADEALAGFSPGDPAAVHVIVATGSGPVDALQEATLALRERGPRHVPPGLVVHGTADAVAGLLSRRYGFLGQAQAVTAACASGAIGIGEGLRRIRHGYAEAVLVVGMEDLLGPVHLAANANLRAVATGFAEEPWAASRPFDRDRRGFVMAQGAAAVLLESADAARRRGAVPVAGVTGFGAASDAHHATAPDPSGRGAAAAIAACLADAGVAPDAVDHVNAHGTGTPLGDEAELVALERALGSRVRRVPVTATKSSTGHLLGASGVVDAVISALTLRDRMLPPTINLADPIRDDWDFVRDRAREHEVRSVLSTSFGFGGHSAALLFSAV